jgi:exodeoxyribonuclease V alpha subunit
VSIQFDIRTVNYEFDDLDEINLAYATTIHKAQGSEYPAVVMPLSMQHYALLERNLLYTGVTRAKKLMVLLGESKAVYMAVNQMRAHQRITNLAAQLRKHLGPFQNTSKNGEIPLNKILGYLKGPNTAQTTHSVVD